jgi:hypothetical protein
MGGGFTITLNLGAAGNDETCHKGKRMPHLKVAHKFHAASASRQRCEGYQGIAKFPAQEGWRGITSRNRQTVLRPPQTGGMGLSKIGCPVEFGILGPG